MDAEVLEAKPSAAIAPELGCCICDPEESTLTGSGMKHRADGGVAPAPVGEKKKKKALLISVEITERFSHCEQSSSGRGYLT